MSIQPKPMKILDRQPKCLCVEDDPDILFVITTILKETGVECILAQDAEQALKAFQENDFDLVLCDIAMPGLSGLELMGKVRSRANEVPFIFVTGLSDAAFVIRAVRLGAVDFIEKPFKSDDFKKSVRRALAIEEKRLQIVDVIKRLGAAGFEREMQQLESYFVQMSMLRGSSERL